MFRDVDMEVAGSWHTPGGACTLAEGCLFALDSDAHAGAELVHAEYAIAHARLAGVPAKRINNTWPCEKLMEWAEGRRA